MISGRVARGTVIQEGYGQDLVSKPAISTNKSWSATAEQLISASKPNPYLPNPNLA